MKKQQLKLPKQLWTEESIDLTRHSYQGKLLTKSEGFKLGKTQRKKIPREQLAQLLKRHGGEVFYPRKEFCTDNGAMIALAGFYRLAAGQQQDLTIGVTPRWPMQELPAV